MNTLVPVTLNSDLLQILYRHFLCKPHMIGRFEKPISILCHLPAINLINDRPPVPASNLPCSLKVSGKMHIKPALRDQPLCINRRDIFFSGTMKKNFRRNLLFQFHIYRDGMTLVCPDQGIFICSTHSQTDGGYLAHVHSLYTDYVFV